MAEFGMGSGVWPLAMATRPASLAPAPALEGAGAGAGCDVREGSVGVKPPGPDLYGLWALRALPLCAAALR